MSRRSFWCLCLPAVLAACGGSDDKSGGGGSGDGTDSAVVDPGTDPAVAVALEHLRLTRAPGYDPLADQGLAERVTRLVG